ncbi:DNA polymerase alpha catalytic subunit [Ixodes scapularis]
MDDDSDSFVKNRAKRSRPDKAGRFAALERLKQVKGGIRSKYELKEEVSVYEEVDEKEYSRLVQKRQEEDWIIDDGGAGYVEDGREIFDDDIGDTDDAPRKEASGTKNKYRPPSSKKVAAPKAGTIAAMFSAQPKKKAEKEINLNDDQLLDNILQSVDRQSSGPSMSTAFVLTPKAPRKSAGSSALKSPANPFAKNGQNLSSRADVKPRLNYSTIDIQTVVSRRQPEDKEEIKIEQFDTQELSCDFNIEEDSPPSPLAEAPHENDQTVDEDLACFADAQNDDFHMESEENGQTANAGLDLKVGTGVGKEESLDDSFPEWTGVVAEDAVRRPADVKVESLPLVENENGEKVVRFFWLDAYEDYFKNPGVVHLFGKVKLLDASTYASCTVTVCNIPRKVYLLPRPFHFDSAVKAETDEPVTMKDVYDEFRCIAEKQRIEEFKTKAVTKRYAFDKEGVPAEAEYLEIVYPARFPELPKDLTGRTFSAVFGTNTSSLESLLIGQKLMGPCWLELQNPTAPNVPVSWCKLEVVLSKPGDIVVAKSESAPPLVVMSLSIRTVPNDATNQNEVVAVSVLAHHTFPIDKQAPSPLYQTHFCALTRPSGTLFPYGFTGSMCKHTTLEVVDSERSLLILFAAKLQRLDPDIIVGHDVQSYDLNVLLHRMITNKIPNWSRLGRLKRGNAAVLVKADKQMTPGRLVCDLKISSKELVQCKSYDLTELARTLLHKQRLELGPERLQSMYSSSAQLLKLVDLTMMDAEFCLRLMSELNVLPLALQITNIAGNVLSRTLLGGRSQRNEYLLLHAFSDRNYICPDKSFKKQAVKAPDDDETELPASKNKSKKGPTYSGGLVLEPKKGFYDSFILLMDFNSLYPSIIQEYNICFTTVDMSKGGGDAAAEDQIPELPGSSAEPGVLPSEIRKLVESRRQVKNLMKAADVGADLYQQVKAEINKLYKQLEIDIDGIFKSMLLLKKKKYAALVVSVGPNGQVSTTKQLKGLDVVRRDWSELARKTGEYVIDELLSDNTREDIVEKIHSYLMQLAAKIQGDSLPLSDFCVTKQLTKNPEDYPDKKNLSHVQVALRLNSKRGKKLKQGDTVTYVICNDGSSQTATQRAYHPEELKGNDSLSIDKQYYLAQQIHPVVARICAPIDGTDAAMIAEVLGLNPAHYRHYNHNEEDDTERRLNDGGASGLALYKSCERVKLRCPSEGCTAVIAVEDIFERTGMELRFVLEECPQCKTALCGYINALCNQVTLFIRDCISKFYAGWLVCEDSVCCHRTRRLPLRFVKASPLCFACERSVMHPEYKTSDLYNQLRYLSKLFDFSRAVASLPESDKKSRCVTSPETERTCRHIQQVAKRFLARNGYSTVQLRSVFADVYRPLDPEASRGPREGAGLDSGLLDAAA